MVYSTHYVDMNIVYIVPQNISPVEDPTFLPISETNEQYQNNFQLILLADILRHVHLFFTFQFFCTGQLPICLPA
jgi:hypothetical protein